MEPFQVVTTVLTTLLKPNDPNKDASSNNDDETCEVCNKVFSNARELRNHKRNVHDDKKHACTMCDRRFRTNSDLKNHTKRMHSTGDKKFDCDACDRSFKTKTGLQYHTNCAHSASPQFFCHMCSQAFPVKGGYEKHMRAVHEGVTYACDACDRKYRYEHDLLIHKKVHEPDYVYPECQICQKVFPTKNAQQKHMIRNHSVAPKQKYVCEICGLALANSISLRDHRMIHTGEKPNVCDICGKSFIKISCLTSHMRIHTKEKPYVCSVCGKGFNQKTPLTVHIRSLHSKERPYQCYICSKTFVTRGLLKMHSNKTHGIAMADIMTLSKVGTTSDNNV